MEDHLPQNSRPFYKAIFSIIFSVFILTSCHDEPIENIITGGADAEILNLRDSTVHLYSELLPMDQIKGKSPVFDARIKVDSNGTFIYPHMFSEGYYFLQYDGFKVKYFIEEGKILSMDIDASKPADKPNFSNKMKLESRYLFDKHMVVIKFQSNEEGFFVLNENEFLTVVNQLRSTLDKMLVLYITNRPGGSAYFMKQESLSNYYYVATLLERYELKHKELVGDVTFAVSDSFANLTQNFSLNDTNAITNSNYYNYLESKTIATVGYPKDLSSAYAQLSFIDSTVFVESYRDYLIFNTTREVAKWDESDTRDIVLDSLVGRVSDKEIREFLILNVRQDTISIADTLSNSNN